MYKDSEASTCRRNMVLGASPKTALDVVKGKDLTGKTAVVTGGNSGLPLCLALESLAKSAYKYISH